MMMMNARIALTVTSILLSASRMALGFSPLPQAGEPRSFSSALYYVRDQATPPAIATPLKEPGQKVSIQKETKGKLTKPKIREIKSLEELQYFLEEDERPVAIK